MDSGPLVDFIDEIQQSMSSWQWSDLLFSNAFDSPTQMTIKILCMIVQCTMVSSSVDLFLAKQMISEGNCR